MHRPEYRFHDPLCLVEEAREVDVGHAPAFWLTSMSSACPTTDQTATDLVYLGRVSNQCAIALNCDKSHMSREVRRLSEQFAALVLSTMFRSAHVSATHSIIPQRSLRHTTANVTTTRSHWWHWRSRR
jgi:hypothetical protein